MAFPFQNFHLKDGVGPAYSAIKRLHRARDAARCERVGAKGKLDHIRFAVPIGIGERMLDSSVFAPPLEITVEE